MRKLLLFTLASLFFFSCRDKIPAPEFGFEYFGWEEGSYVTYEVTSIFHDAALVPANDTSRYILKTVVGEISEDNLGRPARKFYRHTFDQSTGELVDLRVWRGIIADSRAELIEENQRIIRLVFAITPEKTWNINAFNSKAEQTASYAALHQPGNWGEFSFDSTVRVEYQDFFSLVDYRVKYDVYAKHVGLVHRWYKDLDIQNFDTLDIRSGSELHYRLIDYGKE